MKIELSEDDIVEVVCFLKIFCEFRPEPGKSEILRISYDIKRQWLLRGE